jgi:hypothetical protein
MDLAVKTVENLLRQARQRELVSVEYVRSPTGRRVAAYRRPA